MEVLPLFSTLRLNMNPFAQGMMQATSIASIFPSAMQSFMANPLLGVIDLTKQVASGIISMVTSAAGAMDDMGDRAANLGISVRDLSSLTRVGKLQGVEDFSDAIKFLQKNAAEALAGNKTMAASFASLGVDAAQPTMQLLYDVADALAAMEDPGKRTNVSMELLGRGGSQLVGTLAQGSAALRQMMRDVNPLGDVMNDQSSKIAGGFTDAMDTLKYAWEDVKAMLAQEVAIPLTEALRSLLSYAQANGPAIQQMISSVASAFLQGLTLSIDGVNILIGLSQELLAVWLTIKGAQSGMAIGSFFGPVGTIVGGVAGGAAGFGAGAYAGGKIETNLAPMQEAMGRFTDAVKREMESGSRKVAGASAGAAQAEWDAMQRRQNAAFDRARLEGRL